MKRCARGLEIQSVVFDAAAWNARAARGWLLAHQFKAPKVDKTKSELRYRQRPQAHFVKGSFRRIDLEKSKGIFAVVACPRPGYESDKKKNPAKKPNSAERERIARPFFRHFNAIEDCARDARAALEKWTRGKRFDPQLDLVAGALYDVSSNARIIRRRVDRLEADIAKGTVPNPAKLKPSKKRAAAPAKKKPKKKTTTTTTTTKKTTVTSNPGMWSWSPRIPKVLVQHGRCVELRVELDDGEHVAKFTWPKRGESAMWLLTDSSGRRLFVCPWNKVPSTRAEFDSKFQKAGRAATAAGAQWAESTGKLPDIGSIIKVPERKVRRVGRCAAITYYFDIKHRDSSPREHVFDNPPLVKMDNDKDPKLIVISGGDLVVGLYGIEG